MMPSVLITRVVGILVVGLTVWAAPSFAFWIGCVFALGLAHYTISVFYSRLQIVDLYRSPQRLIPLLSLGAWGGILFLGSFPLVWFFALHHAFNESYLLRRSVSSGAPGVREFRSVGVLLHVFLYLTLLRHDPALQFIPAEFLFAGLGASYVMFALYLSRIRQNLTRSAIVENCGFELLGIAVLVASVFFKFSFLQVVMYHFVFWMLYPLPKLWSSESSELSIYLGMTIVCLSLFVWLSPRTANASDMFQTTYFEQFTLWSYFHITTSFALSNAHPDWIIRLFRPRSVETKKS